jgi:hypothetical protein
MPTGALGVDAGSPAGVFFAVGRPPAGRGQGAFMRDLSMTTEDREVTAQDSA